MRLTLPTTLALSLVVAAQAQPGPAAPVPQSAPTPPDPTALPGLRPPAPLADMLRYPRPHPASEQAPDLTPAPPVDLALEAAQKAVATCTTQGLRIGVAVTDSAGQLRVALTADQARPGLVYVAVRKALAAMAFKRPTSAVQALLRADPSAASALSPNMAVNPGAVPLIVDNHVIGAIGASGATAQQDEACAAAGAEFISGRLK